MFWDFCLTVSDSRNSCRVRPALYIYSIKSPWLHCHRSIYCWRILYTAYTGILAEHRRRMETDGKAKVAASVWGGGKFVQLLAALAVLSRSI